MYKHLRKIINEIAYYNSNEIDECCDNNPDMECDYIASYFNTYCSSKTRLGYQLTSEDVYKIRGF